MKNKKLIIFLYGACIINNVYAEEQNIIQKFEALLGRTRLIHYLHCHRHYIFLIELE